MFKIKLSVEQSVTLLDFLISTVNKLDKDNEELRDQLEICRLKKENINETNEKLRHRINSFYSKTDKAQPF